METLWRRSVFSLVLSKIVVTSDLTNQKQILNHKKQWTRFKFTIPNDRPLKTDCTVTLFLLIYSLKVAVLPLVLLWSPSLQLISRAHRPSSSASWYSINRWPKNNDSKWLRLWRLMWNSWKRGKLVWIGCYRRILEMRAKNAPPRNLQPKWVSGKFLKFFSQPGPARQFLKSAGRSRLFNWREGADS